MKDWKDILYKKTKHKPLKPPFVKPKTMQQKIKTKKDLTKSFFSGDKNYYNEMLNAFPKANVNGDVYDTINNIASMYARSLDY